jgi:hypothetical protein
MKSSKWANREIIALTIIGILVLFINFQYGIGYLVGSWIFYFDLRFGKDY